MIAVGYMLLYLLHGTLPWAIAKSDDDVMNMKKSIKRSSLCGPKDPRGLVSYLEAVMLYKPADIPDYDHLTSLLQSCMTTSSLAFDWMSKSSVTKTTKAPSKVKAKSSLKSKAAISVVEPISPPATPVIVNTPVKPASKTKGKGGDKEDNSPEIYGVFAMEKNYRWKDG